MRRRVSILGMKRHSESAETAETAESADLMAIRVASGPSAASVALVAAVLATRPSVDTRTAIHLALRACRLSVLPHMRACHALRSSVTTASHARHRGWSTWSNGIHRETAHGSPALFAALSHAVLFTARRSVRTGIIDAVWHCRARRSTDRASHRAAAKSGDAWRGHAAQTMASDYHRRPVMTRCVDGRRQGGLSRDRADWQIPQFPQFLQFRTDFFSILGSDPKVTRRCPNATSLSQVRDSASSTASEPHPSAPGSHLRAAVSRAASESA